MENKKEKCSLKKHSEIDAIGYCYECKIFFCSKCKNIHSQLFENHNIYSENDINNINNNINEIFFDICKEEKHNNKFEFFCKTHNKLCCLACICKIKKEEYGQHANCDACLIKDIKEEKQKKLIENINYLENLANNLVIKDFKASLESIIKNKESLKLKVQKIFTKIRNTLNEREDQLLLEVDEQFNNTFLKEDILKEYEKLPNKIKSLLEKGKRINESLKDNNLNLFINNCINIENNINNIIEINEKINKFNVNKNIEINFEPKENNINYFLENIQSFGKISISGDACIFKFNNCPLNISEDKKYKVEGDKENIVTKIGEKNQWVGITCEPKLRESKEYKWKIKILKSVYKNIMFGAAPFDFDINTSFYEKYGWYLFCFKDYKNPDLYSGPPNNYSGHKTNLNKVKDEIIIVLDISKRTLKFIIDNEDRGASYENIPIEKPIVPVIFLYNKDDSVEILEC